MSVTCIYDMFYLQPSRKSVLSTIYELTEHRFDGRKWIIRTRMRNLNKNAIKSE